MFVIHQPPHLHQKINQSLIYSPLGAILVGYDQKYLLSSKFIDTYNQMPQLASNTRIETYRRQFQDYFTGKSKNINTQFFARGTHFQLLVWSKLTTIPYGKTISYMQLAKLIKMPSAIRAVAQACKHNPLPIIIPCHRVIGKNKSLTGYNQGLWRKKWLLDFERKNLSNF